MGFDNFTCITGAIHALKQTLSYASLRTCIMYDAYYKLINKLLKPPENTLLLRLLQPHIALRKHYYNYNYRYIPLITVDYRIVLFITK